jgi:hypothetical protein
MRVEVLPARRVPRGKLGSNPRGVHLSVAFAHIGNRACADRSRLGRAVVLLPLCCSGHQGKYRTGPRRAVPLVGPWIFAVSGQFAVGVCHTGLGRQMESAGWAGADRDTAPFTGPRRRAVESLSPRARDLGTEGDNSFVEQLRRLRSNIRPGILSISWVRNWGGWGQAGGLGRWEKGCGLSTDRSNHFPGFMQR